VSKDFSELLQALLDEGVRFLVVGAYAVAVHGIPRATVDLDIWIDPESGNAAKAYRALARFGAPMDTLSVADLARPDLEFQLGVPPHRIDVRTRITGVGFAEAWPNRVEVSVEGILVPVIGRDALVANKRATGRPKDLVDLDVIERLQPI